MAEGRTNNRWVWSRPLPPHAVVPPMSGPVAVCSACQAELGGQVARLVRCGQVFVVLCGPCVADLVAALAEPGEPVPRLVAVAPPFRPS
jgi:hypothetical protein